MRIEAWVRRWWSGEAGAAGAVADLLAWPLECLYRGAVGVRNRAYDRGWLRVERARIPVLSIGNLSVGGTGKTPVSAWLARRLADRGLRVAVAVRGYAPDEVLLHQRWNPGVPVHAARRRARAVAAATAAGTRLAILDDAFQHRRIYRDADVVLLAAEEPPGARLLPRGPLREPPEALRRADLVVVTRRTAEPEHAEARATWVGETAPQVPVARIALAPAAWQLLEGSPAAAPLGDVLAVAGVARPDLFATTAARALGREVEFVPFPDHHAYTRQDALALRARAGERTLVTTEKDAVKLVQYSGLLGDCRVLVLVIHVEHGEEHLDALLTGLQTRAAARLDRPAGGAAAP
ncbi:MAG: tetraacyldisaccharide 4'-kinase [Gemmatimonadetes bacterium]|nr:tetraacyldisaccharide 4'-kinase [Gemmatimonadota bacterium]